MENWNWEKFPWNLFRTKLWRLLSCAILVKNDDIKEKNVEFALEWQLHKNSHKGIDACWEKIRDGNYYGYKRHVKVDRKAKPIETHHTTDVGVNGSNVIKPLITEKNSVCILMPVTKVGKMRSGHVGCALSSVKNGAATTLWAENQRSATTNSQRKDALWNTSSALSRSRFIRKIYRYHQDSC